MTGSPGRGLQLSAAQARRIALAAQGFRDPRHTVPTMRTFDRTLSRTGVLQVDSVNVLQRAHLMPLFSRMGPYDPMLLERASTGRSRRRLVEYWAHVQALMPVELWPVMRHRMERYRAQRGKWGAEGVTDQLMASLLAEIRERGASTARELDDGLPRTKDHWGWNWSTTRRALDAMFSAGEVAIAGRNTAFECLYDLPDRVIPSAYLAMPDPDPSDAHRELVRRAARSHGVATLADLADYYRMTIGQTKPAVDELVEAGELVETRVEGWSRPGWLHTEAARPRQMSARALLSPFDPVVWHRPRAESLFDFHYRIEIYVPAPQRRFGYYVLPFLLGDRIVGRTDLKADRAGRRLLVQSAWAEPGAPAETAAELAEELRSLCTWLSLDDIVVADRGDLAGPLAAQVRVDK